MTILVQSPCIPVQFSLGYLPRSRTVCRVIGDACISLASEKQMPRWDSVCKRFTKEGEGEIRERLQTLLQF